MFNWIKKTLQYSVSWDLQKDLYNLFKKIFKRKYSFKKFHNHNDKKNLFQKNESVPFNRILSNWNIERKKISKTIKIYYLSIFIYFLLGCWGTFILIFSHNYMIKYEGCLLIILFIVMATTKFWRINILLNQRFISFTEWLKFPLLFKKNGGK